MNVHIDPIAEEQELFVVSLCLQKNTYRKINKSKGKETQHITPLSAIRATFPSPCVDSDKSNPPLGRPKRYVPGTGSSVPKKPRFNCGEFLLFL